MKIETNVGCIGAIILAIFLGFLMYLLLDYANYRDVEINSYKKNIGLRMVVKNDTIILFDYDSEKDSYVLSNGVSVSREYIMKQKLIK